jgi:CRP/FNR family transcriptional regulator
METLYSQFIDHIRSLVPLSDNQATQLLDTIEVKKLARKELLLQPNQVSRHMRYVAQGSLRVYYLDEKAQERTLQLGIENWWVNDLYSYFKECPSRMFIQAQEPSVIFQLSKNRLEELYKSIPMLSDFFRIKIQNAYVALQERTIEQSSVDASTRYQDFIQRYRHLEQRFPQYVIASYLGVTPEFLSYLRNKSRGAIS